LKHLVSAVAAQIPPTVIWVEEQDFVLAGGVLTDNIVGKDVVIRANSPIVT
jgi:hypothetical protein